jgi:hypothetical protein
MNLAAQSPTPSPSPSLSPTLAPWRDVLDVRIGEGFSVDVSMGLVGIALVALAVVIAMFVTRTGWRNWRAERVEVQFGSVSVSLKRTHEVVRVAHEAWAEIITRKAALPFDEEHDLVVDIYSSWYELFKELRALIRTIPAEQMQGKSGRAQSARDLVRVLEEVLNQGLRPHLTQFQSRFRPWYEHKTKEYTEELDGQFIQSQFRDYDELLADMRAVNGMMVKFSQDLKRIAQGDVVPPDPTASKP